MNRQKRLKSLLFVRNLAVFFMMFPAPHRLMARTEANISDTSHIASLLREAENSNFDSAVFCFGEVYLEQSRYPEAMQKYHESLEYFTKAGDSSWIFWCYTGMGIVQTGSIYNGMPVMSKTSPVDFVRLIAIPFAHPHARQVNIISVQAISERSLQSSANRPVLLPDTEPTSESAVVTFEYLENNMLFTEKMVCVIEDHDIGESGIWENKETFFMRAEKELFTSMAPLFVTINQSIKPGNQTEKRAGIGNIVLSNVIYLNLTELADYINPFTGETEYGCSEWKYRWINCQGDMVCSNDPSYDPERNASLRLQGFKRSEPRKHSK